MLVPIGFGILIGNIPFREGMNLSVYEDGSVLSILYQGVTAGLLPAADLPGHRGDDRLLGDALQPRLILLGAAAQAGIFLTFLGSLFLGFDLEDAAAIGIIGGADGPTAIFLSANSRPHLWAPSPSRPTRTWRWCR